MKFGRILSRSVLAAAAAMGSAALAADALPLVRGVYVRSGTACKGAPNSDTLSYRGGNNGINSQPVVCTIIRHQKRGTTYVLDRACHDIRSGGSYSKRIEVKVLSTTSFNIAGDSYRYCGPKVQLR